MIILMLFQVVFAQRRPITFDTDVGIEGQQQKPEVFLSLQKGDTSNAYELELRESFIPKILETMKKDPL